MEQPNQNPKTITIQFQNEGNRQTFIRLINYLCQYVCYNTHKSINDKLNQVITTQSQEIELSEHEINLLIIFFITQSNKI
jgi:hypothetical protein